MNTNWKYDDLLKGKLELYVAQCLKRTEIVELMKKEFGNYPWSLSTLTRRFNHFGIRYTDTEVPVESVREAVSTELRGPGQLLGYRAMHKKLRVVHGLKVPRSLVHDVMFLEESQLLKDRRPCQKKKRVKGHFVSNGPNWVHSFDGHDKLMGYQNSTFPLAVYGCIDTASRKILWLKIWTSNSDPKLVGKWYLQHIIETKRISNMVRLDKGTETGDLAAIHCFLRSRCDENLEDPSSVIHYGPSTSNQIERWWKELHERLEKFFKGQLLFLKCGGHYDPSCEQDRMILAYIMIPILQAELNTFKDVIWNCHRIRYQKDQVLPDGVPNHIYTVPEVHDLVECGFDVSDQDIQSLIDESGITPEDADYLDDDFRHLCEQYLPNLELVKPHECQEAYIYLKREIENGSF
ncbi:uncharacterized protein [Clytia hemisphaerica]|uniref:uncharacterized protein n=1 Tax=Clytia hemisphaerica TaxID=252671 RepID=UPI0034D5F59C